jgi:preprotein translocase subunit SecF
MTGIGGMNGVTAATTVAEPAADGVPGVDRRHRFADLYHERTNYRFMRHRRRYVFAFAGVVLVSVAALAVRNLNLGIDFEGGVSWLVEVAPGTEPSVAEVRDLLEPLGFGDAKVTTIASAQNGTETIRVQSEELADDPVKLIRDAMADATATEPADVTVNIAGRTGTFAVDGVAAPDQARIEAALRAIDGVEPTVTITAGDTGSSVAARIDEMPPSPLDQVTDALAEYAGRSTADVSINTVGPTWGGEVSRKALQALIVFFLVLAVYLTLRFEFKMAMAAIVAVVHDIVFTVGFYALLQFEVTPATVTAFLTILGFSLYDTVVVFDKIKENTSQVGTPGRTYADTVDRSLNQVLMRSLSTSLVALLPVTSLLLVGSLLLGATALEDFAIALLVGLFIGSYSSIFVAAPLLCTWKEREPQYRALQQRRARAAQAPPARAVARRPAPRPAADAPEEPDDIAAAWDPTGIPGPPAVPRAAPGAIAPRPRQQRRRKRR